MSFLSIVQQWLFVGLAEELLFRGYLIRRFQLYYARKTDLNSSQISLRSVVVASATFALFHIPVRLFNGFNLLQLALSLIMVFGIQGDLLQAMLLLIGVELYRLLKKEGRDEESRV
ncbi:MAG: CPBP family intramembrane glutamic endopeptidase [Bacillota bacterium]